jgi:hypothetical protein
MTMNYRTLAASVLALGLLAPVAAKADNINNCSEEQRNRKAFVDCDISTEKLSQQFGAAVIIDQDEEDSADDSTDGSNTSSSSPSAKTN